MLLNRKQRQQLDDTNDREFYSLSQFVDRVDAGFIHKLTDLYRERLSDRTQIFEMMSGSVSYLPEEMTFDRVIGHGANERELANNPRFCSGSALNKERYFVQDLNQDLKLPLASNSFDAVLNTAAVQYLQYPEAIFEEVHRILKPNGIAIFSFSNRMFYGKTIAAWLDKNESDRVRLVKNYFKSVPGFSNPEMISQSARCSSLLPWISIANGDPFYAVIARKIK